MPNLSEIARPSIHVQRSAPRRSSEGNARRIRPTLVTLCGLGTLTIACNTGPSNPFGDPDASLSPDGGSGATASGAGAGSSGSTNGANSGEGGGGSGSGGTAQAGISFGGGLPTGSVIVPTAGAGNLLDDGGVATLPDGESPPACDETALPSAEACLVADAYAVFASAAASGGDGTLAAPFATVTDAVNAARDAGKRFVLLCDGTFSETLTLGEMHGGLTIMGGFDCDTWQYAPDDNETLVAPSALAPALRVRDVEQDLLLHTLSFVARPALNPSESSIAVTLEDSATVTLQNVHVTAGDGFDGLDGSAPQYVEADGQWPSASSLDGKDAVGAEGGARTPATCPIGSTRGGEGGDGDVDFPADGEDGNPEIDGAVETAGQGGEFDTECQNGRGGADALASTDGEGGSAAGSLDGATWHATDGTPGADGTPGQGGGGGSGGIHATLGGGGGGAAGGCGGRGALAGKGGGSSLGILSVESTLVLIDSTITAGIGGQGGAGLEGQAGQLGGAGGFQTTQGCPGGNGGDGGKGGASGGGAGGVSAGIVYTGSVPSLSGTTVMLGASGEGGLGGNDSTDTDDGVTPTELELFGL